MEWKNEILLGSGPAWSGHLCWIEEAVNGLRWFESNLPN